MGIDNARNILVSDNLKFKTEGNDIVDFIDEVLIDLSTLAQNEMVNRNEKERILHLLTSFRKMLHPQIA